MSIGALNGYRLNAGALDGIPSVFGASAVAQAADTLVGVGVALVSGSAAKTQGANTLSGSGATAILGAGVLSPVGDSLVGAGALPIVGGASLTPASDRYAVVWTRGLADHYQYASRLTSHLFGRTLSSHTSASALTEH